MSNKHNKRGCLFVIAAPSGGGKTSHAAGGQDALLFAVTNEPLLSFERLRPPEKAVIETVHYPAAEIARVAKAFKVYYRKPPGTKAGTNDYLMDHSSFIYLIGPGGKLRALFRPKTSPETLAREISRFID